MNEMISFVPQIQPRYVMAGSGQISSDPVSCPFVSRLALDCTDTQLPSDMHTALSKSAHRPLARTFEGRGQLSGDGPSHGCLNQVSTANS